MRIRIHDEMFRAFSHISGEIAKWFRRARKVPELSLAKNAQQSKYLHEITLTDITVLSLREHFADSGVVSVWTLTPQQESETGADIQMWIRVRNDGWLGLLIQCKAIARDGCFPELHYKTKSGRYQSDILIAAACKSRCHPIYLLYRDHPGKGNWILSAYRVKQLLGSQCIDVLGNYILPWECIPCLCEFIYRHNSTCLQNIPYCYCRLRFVSELMVMVYCNVVYELIYSNLYKLIGIHLDDDTIISLYSEIYEYLRYGLIFYLKTIIW